MHDFAQRTSTTRVSKRSALSSLQTQQKHHAFWRWIQKALITVILLLLSVCASLGVVVIILLRLSSWKNDRVRSVVLLTSEQENIRKHVTVVWINPENHELLLYPLPDELITRTPSSGAYAMSSLYGLFALDHQPMSVFLKNLARNIRVDVQDLAVQVGPLPDPQNVSIMFEKILLSQNIKTSLSFPDRFSLWWYTTVGKYQTQVIHPPTSDPQILDNVTYDTFVRKTFVDTRLKKEEFSVALVNASGESKIASTVGRLLTSLGVNVISLGDISTPIETARIILLKSSIQNSASLQVIGHYIDGVVITDPSIATEYRADIVIFLGKKEADLFTP